MSGHSKWETSHRQKELIDAKRGAIFTKYSNMIKIAARSGSNPESNPSLRSAIDQARSVSMPKDNIERAIKKGSGELEGGQVYELFYEGTLAHGIQIIVKCLTDNKNRSGAAIRHIFAKNGGEFSPVLWNFKQLGVINISLNELLTKKIDSDELELKLIDQGITDFIKEDEMITIYTEIKKFQTVRNFLEDQGLKLESAKIEYLAQERIGLAEKNNEKMSKFFEELDENEDVADYYSNLE